MQKEHHLTSVRKLIPLCKIKQYNSHNDERPIPQLAWSRLRTSCWYLPPLLSVIGADLLLGAVGASEAIEVGSVGRTQRTGPTVFLVLCFSTTENNCAITCMTSYAGTDLFRFYACFL